MEGELRCPSRIQGIITSSGLLEIKCRSKACGAKRGVVVLHYFDLSSGELVPVDTKILTDPLALYEDQQKQQQETLQCP